MVRDLVDIEVSDAGLAFEAAVNTALPVIEGVPGCHGLTLHRSTERPGRYWLLVEWDLVGHHEAFRTSAAFNEWRTLVGHYFTGPLRVEHLERAVGKLNRPYIN